jgi:hypothetical protein
MAQTTHHAASARTPRQDALFKGAAQWRDPNSVVRQQAREALHDVEWPAPVVEAALQDVLRDAESTVAGAPEPVTSLTVLAILPGNVIGPAIATAYCAAAAGAALMLKSSSRELHLVDIVANQFKTLGSPVAGTLEPMRWSGGDVDWEAKIFPRAQRIVAFGDDETIADIRGRAPQGVDVVAYGSAYSVGFVLAASDVSAVAEAAARDVAMFDQRGCLSPQTIYVEGDDSRAILFGHALARALASVGHELPRASAGMTERAAIGEFVRRLHVRALPSSSHALGTVLAGPASKGYPEFVVGIEPFSSPVCAGFGRLVVVKPCAGLEQAASAVSTLGARLDSVGTGGAPAARLTQRFLDAGALRVCLLGEMQRPPFGYRPRISDFTEGRT